MDPISHAAFGAAWSQQRASRADLGAGGLAGLIGAIAPDVDVLIRSSSDPLLFLEMHRHFTHALAFVPVGAFLAAALLHYWLRERLEFRRTWTFCMIGYASHVLLDACTSYGTQLMWPFSAERVAWSIVSIVDPLFTVPLLALTSLAVYRRRRGLALGALCWAAAYLAFGAVQAQRAQSGAEALAASRGHVPARLTAMPSFANAFVWKTIYVAEGRYHVDAVRTGLTLEAYPGESLPVLDAARDLPWLVPGTRQAEDLSRFRAVADGYVALDPAVPNRIIEMRYSLVPNQIAPFWAIELDPDAGPERHARFVTTLERTPAQGLRLLRMLLGDTSG